MTFLKMIVGTLCVIAVIFMLVISKDILYPSLKKFSIGDTVLVDVPNNASFPGVVVKKYDDDYYIKFLEGCNCNNWYWKHRVHPYSPSWNK